MTKSTYDHLEGLNLRKKGIGSFRNGKQKTTIVHGRFRPVGSGVFSQCTILAKIVTRKRFRMPSPLSLKFFVCCKVLNNSQRTTATLRGKTAAMSCTVEWLSCGNYCRLYNREVALTIHYCSKLLPEFQVRRSAISWLKSDLTFTFQIQKLLISRIFIRKDVSRFSIFIKFSNACSSHYPWKVNPSE